MRRLNSLLLALALASPLAAQPFTLDGEFAKQRKYYPSIEKYTSDRHDLVVKSDVIFKVVGSDTLRLDFFRPAGRQEPLTPLVFIHGGGWRSGDRSLDYPMAQNLARRGFATFCVDYRLSDVALYPAGLQDINSALAFIAAHLPDFNVDISRLTMIGSSSGGQMVALLGAANGTVDKFSAGETTPPIYRVIDIDGVLAFIHPDSAEGQDRPGKPAAATLWFGCTSTDNKALWEEASAINHVGSQSAHFVFINSQHKRFSAGQQEMSVKLKKNNKEVSVFKTTDTPHTFWLFLPWARLVEDVIASEASR